MRGSDRIEIGAVSKAHGIKGEVVVVLHDPGSTVIEGLHEIWLDGERRAVAGVRPGPHGWLVRLEGIDDRTRAETLRGAVVEVDHEDVPLDDGEVILDDLIGCRVVRDDGAAWGEIVAIDVGFQDRLVIHDGAVERLLPLVDVFVTDIDLDAGVVTVSPPEGLPETPIERASKPRRR